MRQLGVAAALAFYMLLVATSTMAAPATPSGAVSTDQHTVVMAQIAHRHGARTPLVGYNGSILCGKLGCGNLNADGKEMLVQVGAWANDRYISGTNSQTNYMKPGTGYSQYSPNYIASRSTDLSRTIQSADGFLRGFFPDLANFYPVISTVNFWDDKLLLVDALSAFHIPATVELEENWKKFADDQLKDWKKDVVQKIGKELSLDDSCITQYPARLAQCLLLAQDVAASFNATGQLQNGSGVKDKVFGGYAANNSKYETTWDYLPELMDVREKWNDMFFPYDPKNSLDKKRGALGQNLAQEIVASFKQHIANEGPIYAFKEWSAHDTTMMPLCATLGANDLMLPLFGESFFFELLVEDGENSDELTKESNYFVRGLYGHPIQDPYADSDKAGVKHKFTPSVFPLHCMNKDNSVYVLDKPDMACPLEDWHRFINSSKPTEAAGLCYVEPSVLSDDKLNCPPNNASAPKPGSDCAFYRYHCPKWACGSNFLDFSDLSCQSKTNQGVRTGTVTIITLASVGAGFVIGAVIAAAFSRKKGAVDGADGYDAVNANDNSKSV